MRVNKLDCNEGRDETKRFLGAKNTPKVPVSCSCLSNGSRTPESHHRNIVVFSAMKLGSNTSNYNFFLPICE